LSKRPQKSPKNHKKTGKKKTKRKGSATGDEKRLGAGKMASSSPAAVGVAART